MDDTNEKISHLTHRGIRAHNCLVRHRMHDIINTAKHEAAKGTPYPNGYLDNLQLISELVLLASDQLADYRRENARNGQ